MLFRDHNLERLTAVASFVAAVGLAFYSLYLSQTHDILAGACMLVAQFLLLTASIFGIDYKFSSPYGTIGNHPEGHTQQ